MPKSVRLPIVGDLDDLVVAHQVHYGEGRDQEHQLHERVVPAWNTPAIKDISFIEVEMADTKFMSVEVAIGATICMKVAMKDTSFISV
eukprot:scaffold279807_cov26-Tisochrysis_lutea.AAC.1